MKARITEAKWQEAKAVHELDLYRTSQQQYRRWRLFAAACCHRAMTLAPDRRLEAVAASAELFADGLVTWDEVKKVRRTIAFGAATRPDFDRGFAREERQQIDIARDIFGNPFRPVAFDPSWRTSTVVALAQQMYDTRDFGLMPILGDALQDAGCDNDDILAHCRDGNATHGRGCWVVDLVLGKG